MCSSHAIATRRRQHKVLLLGEALPTARGEVNCRAWTARCVLISGDDALRDPYWPPLAARALSRAPVGCRQAAALLVGALEDDWAAVRGGPSIHGRGAARAGAHAAPPPGAHRSPSEDRLAAESGPPTRLPHVTAGPQARRPAGPSAGLRRPACRARHGAGGAAGRRGAQTAPGDGGRRPRRTARGEPRTAQLGPVGALLMMTAVGSPAAGLWLPVAWAIRRPLASAVYGDGTARPAGCSSPYDHPHGRVTACVMQRQRRAVRWPPPGATDRLRPPGVRRLPHVWAPPPPPPRASESAQGTACAQGGSAGRFGRAELNPCVRPQAHWARPLGPRVGVAPLAGRPAGRPVRLGASGSGPRSPARARAARGRGLTVGWANPMHAPPTHPSSIQPRIPQRGEGDEGEKLGGGEGGIRPVPPHAGAAEPVARLPAGRRAMTPFRWRHPLCRLARDPATATSPLKAGHSF